MTMALISAADNIPKIANANNNPVGAVQGVLSLMASISQVVSPIGQKLSIGFMLFSSLLSLVGLGKKPKPIGEIVREQINEALDEFYDRQISDEASAAIYQFEKSSNYVDGVGRYTDKVSEKDVGPLLRNAIHVKDVRVMGLLATQIDKMKRENNLKNAKKCFKYVHLYLTLSTFSQEIMTKLIALIPGTLFPATIRGYLSAQEGLIDANRKMIKFLHDPNERSKLMPYFDGEKYPIITDYMKKILKIPRPNHFPGSGYCITAYGWGRNYLGKFYKERVYPHMSHPLGQVSRQAYCKWKLYDHGNNIFTIISDDGMLSYDNSDIPVASLEHDDPAMWEILRAGEFKSRWW